MNHLYEKNNKISKKLHQEVIVSVYPVESTTEKASFVTIKTMSINLLRHCLVVLSLNFDAMIVQLSQEKQEDDKFQSAIIPNKENNTQQQIWNFN